MKTYYNYHVYQEESPNLVNIFKQLKSLGAFCLSVMLQILADRVTIHKKLYRGRPKVHAATLITLTNLWWCRHRFTASQLQKENCCGWDRGGNIQMSAQVRCWKKSHCPLVIVGDVGKTDFGKNDFGKWQQQWQQQRQQQQQREQQQQQHSNSLINDRSSNSTINSSRN